MPDVDSNALRRAKTLREEINARTGISDTTVTEGVKRLLRSSGTEVAIQHEAAMHLDIYSDPIIAREEFSRMMDYGDFEMKKYNVREFTRYINLEYLENYSNTKVDTGFIPNVLTDKMHIKFAICETRTSTIWPGIAEAQTANNSSGANFGIDYARSGDTIFGYDYNNRLFDIFTGAGITANALTDDGQIVSGNYYRRTTSDNLIKNLTLFYRNNNTDGTNNSNNYGYCRIYFCEIYRNEVLIHNYVPKVKLQVRTIEDLETGKIDEYILSETYGYHDEITDDFLISTGSTPLRKGPYIISNLEDYIFKPIEYLGFTSSQVMYMDFVIQGNQKYLIDLDISQGYGTGISSYLQTNKSASIISTRGSTNITVGAINLPNSGRGIFGQDYYNGESYGYNQIISGSATNRPNYHWYMIGCWFENKVEYYHMTGKVYGYELYDNSITKVKDMKPMEITTKGGYVINYGLYDSINKLLYVAGKGTLQKGPYIN